jgi:hypothetical protein
MMTAMTPSVRKFVLTVHVASSVGLLGAIAVFLVLAVVGIAGGDAEATRTAYPAMKLTTWFAVLPLATASLAIGLIESVGTTWGLFRHYWVVAKLLITVAAVAVLLLQLGVIDYMASAATMGLPLDPNLFEARMSLVAHGAGGLLLLLIPVALSVYKPQGTTRYWRRRQARAS